MVDAGEGSADGRKTKRELSQSKRAAQNRAAQRAFRQRKEGYIKKLESDLQNLGAVQSTCQALQAENLALRQYIYVLQSRLMETAGQCPPPPSDVNISYPQAQAPPTGPTEAPAAAGAAPPVTNPLEVAAQAVAGLSRSEHLAPRDQSHYATKIYEQTHRTDEDARTAEEMARQLQADGPDGLPTAPV